MKFVTEFKKLPGRGARCVLCENVPDRRRRIRQLRQALECPDHVGSEKTETRYTARVRASTLRRRMARGGWQGRLAPTDLGSTGGAKPSAGWRSPRGRTACVARRVTSKASFLLSRFESGHCWRIGRTTAALSSPRDSLAAQSARVRSSSALRSRTWLSQLRISGKYTGPDDCRWHHAGAAPKHGARRHSSAAAAAAAPLRRAAGPRWPQQEAPRHDFLPS